MAEGVVRGIFPILLTPFDDAGRIDEEGLRSEVADLRNTGPRPGGAITAGLFIREFAGDTPWVHLDIAGVAFSDKELPYAAKGGVGFGARTLMEYVLAAAGRG